MAVPVNVIAVVEAPAQIVGDVGAVTVGVIATVIVNVTGVPRQDPIVGVTVTVEEIEFEVEFVAVKVAIFPVPFAPNPVAVLLLLHV